VLDFTQELQKWLAVCAKMLKSAPDVDLELIDVWEVLLNSESVTVPELAFGFQKLLKTETFFPTPAEFLKTLDRVRPSFAVIKDPVICEGDIVASRKAVEKNDMPVLAYVPRALPTNRLEIPDKAMPQLESIEDIENKREAMRRQVGK